MSTANVKRPGRLLVALLSAFLGAVALAGPVHAQVYPPTAPSPSVTATTPGGVLGGGATAPTPGGVLGGGATAPAPSATSGAVSGNGVASLGSTSTGTDVAVLGTRFSLPVTGSELTAMVIGGVVLLVVGGTAVLASRRRRADALHV